MRRVRGFAAPARLGIVCLVLACSGACVGEPARRGPQTAEPAAGAKAPVRDSAPRAFFAEPPDPDAAVVGNDCLACHSGDLLRQQRLTEQQWAKGIEKMRGWGAPTEAEEVAPLLAHLTATAAVGAGAYRAAVLSVDEAASLFERMPDGAFAGGDVGRGAAVYADRCAPCHADDARGGAMGVALAGRHVLDRAPEFAAAIRTGRGRMPGFDDTTDVQIADCLAYLRSLP